MTEKAPILKSGLNRQRISVPSKPPPDLVGTILMIISSSDVLIGRIKPSPGKLWERARADGEFCFNPH